MSEIASQAFLSEQLLQLFGSHSKFPDEFAIAGYLRGIKTLDMSEQEARACFQHFLEEGIDNPKREMPTPAEVRAYVVEERHKDAVAAAPKPYGSCQKCSGCGFKPINEHGQDVSWTTYPRRVMQCDCRKAKAQ